MLGDVLSYFVFLYPVVSAAIWMAGGLIYRFFEDAPSLEEPDGGWPGVTVLVPAFNEVTVIATNVSHALRVDYPLLEVLVLDDGSTDGTREAALAAAAGDPRLRVVRDAANRGKATQLNRGFRTAAHDLVVVTDADTHLHHDAVKYLVNRLASSPGAAAVAGAPHVTNRGSMLSAMQVLEAASIIGLIRRTQALGGRVGTVAGVLGIFRRDAVRAVGGYRVDMATEDIDLSWRLMQAGWRTTYEPSALVGMQVPPTIRSLWQQRRRWARGQGEVLHEHLPVVWRARHWRMWPVVLESLLSLLWVVALAVALFVTIFVDVPSSGWSALEASAAVGIAIASVALLQVCVALFVDHRFAPTELQLILLGPIFPVAYWLVGAGAALREQLVSTVRGPRSDAVAWNIERTAPDGSDRDRRRAR